MEEDATRFERTVMRLLPEGVRPSDAEGRSRIGVVEGAFAGVLNLLLAVSKAFLAWVSGSVSLWADAANNLADIASSVVVMFGFRWARRPRDREHPYGHGRVETLTTLILALILVGVAIEVARSGVSRILAPEPMQAHIWVLVAVAFTVGIKTVMALLVWKLARLTRSTVLEADAWNHGFDIASTSLVLVALIGGRFGWMRLDGFAALGVAFFIAWAGLRYVHTATTALIGQAPGSEVLAGIRRIACRVPGVRAAHDVMVHEYGETRIISLHIEVDATLSVLDAHALAERVESDIADEEGARVTVHVDPVDRSHVLYDEAEAALRGIVADHPELVGYHDLRLDGEPPRYNLSVDLVAHLGVPESEFEHKLDDIRRVVHERIPGVCRIDLGMEAEYASEHERRRVFRRSGREKS